MVLIMADFAYCRRFETKTTHKVTFTVRKRLLTSGNKEVLRNYFNRALEEWLKIVIKEVII